MFRPHSHQSKRKQASVTPSTPSASTSVPSALESKDPVGTPEGGEASTRTQEAKAPAKTAALAIPGVLSPETQDLSHLKKIAQDILYHTKTRICLGIGNIGDPEDEQFTLRGQTILFYRELRDSIFTTLNKKGLLTGDRTDKLTALSLLTALFAETFHVGNCGEFGDVVLFEFLKHQMDISLDIISFKAFPIGDHVWIAVNKEEKAPCSRLETWGDFIRIDAYPLYNCVTTHSKANPLTLKDLTRKNLVEGITDIESDLRISKKFNVTDWLRILSVLENAKRFITLETIDPLRKKHKLTLSSTEIRDKILAQLTEEISSYSKLAAGLPLETEALPGTGRITKQLLMFNLFNIQDDYNREAKAQMTAIEFKP